MRRVALIAIVPLLLHHEPWAAAQEPPAPSAAQQPTTDTPPQAPPTSTSDAPTPPEAVVAPPTPPQPSATSAPFVLSRPTTIAEYDRVIAEHLARANRSSGAEREAEMATVRKLWEWHREDVRVRSTGMVIGGLAVAFSGAAGAAIGAVSLQKNETEGTDPGDGGLAILIPSVVLGVGGVVMVLVGMQPVMRNTRPPTASFNLSGFSF